MASAAPVPKPRTNVIDGQSKKPIPKPRQRAVISSSLCDASRSESAFCAKCNATSVAECSCDRVNDYKQSTTDTVSRSKSATENKKIVGTRLKDITKRFTTRPLSPGKEGKSESKVLRSHSLPSGNCFHSAPLEDIFQSITFKSPIENVSNSSAPAVFLENTEEECDRRVYNAPPPVYPPPPLPDESMYDEVQSVAFSGSGSSNISSCGSTASRNKIVVAGAPRDYAYEHVAIDFIEANLPNKSAVISESSITVNNPTPRICVSRSDSWSFYDSAFGDKAVSEDGFSVGAPTVKDSVSLMSGGTWSRSSVSPSPLSELEAALDCISEDDNFDEIGSNLRTSVSTPQSVNIQNDIYDAWQPIKTVSDSVTLRTNENKRNLPSKSVLYTFDPLFSRGESAFDKSNHSILLQPENYFVQRTEAIYGNINQTSKGKFVELPEHTYDEVPVEVPPVPPRRIDSMPLTADCEYVPYQKESEKHKRETLGTACEIQLGEEIVLYNQQRPETKGSLESLSLPLQKALSSDDVSRDNTRHPQKKRELTRLASMRKAIRIVKDRSPRLGLQIRDQLKGSQTQQDKQKKVEFDTKTDVVERPEIPKQLSFPHSGLLFKVGVGRDKQQDYVHRWCVLAEDKLTFYADKSATVIKEVITLQSILSLQVVRDRKVSVDGDCFMISTCSRTCTYIFGTSGPSERRIWMQKILESLTSVFPLRVISDYTQSGWCYLKEGISGKWSTAWILIHKRVFYYCVDKIPIQEIDLRKARCVALQDSQQDTSVLRVSEKGPSVLLDCQGLALYLYMDTAHETRAWQKVVESSAVDNGPNLDQQQLTKDDIPVIVDKCINFVYAHGSMSEGIYRRSGTNSCVTKLLELFRLNAWSVQLSRQEYSEYDVSSVLKRFFRDIPEPLMTTELHGQFCDIAAGKFSENKVALYRRALEQLPPINFLTTRKLISHLHSIHEQREKNRMPVENLAAIWGPSLLHIEASESLEWSKNETAVVADLIRYHVQLFGVDVEELNREERIKDMLIQINSGITTLPQTKQSGELHVWVYLNNRNSGNCVHITAGPQRLAGEVCTDLAERMKIPAHELVLQEVVCNGSLTRFLHYTEKVLDTVLRWSYWDECDRKDNSLIVTRNDALKEVVPLAKPPLVMSGELRFADKKSKSFKPFVFEFSQAKLCYYKDKKGSEKTTEWQIEDIVWYMGYEPKRNPQTRWAITFIEKNKSTNRSKSSPFFGNTIAGTSKDEQLRWMAALLIGEYPQGLFMSPTLLS